MSFKTLSSYFLIICVAFALFGKQSESAYRPEKSSVLSDTLARYKKCLAEGNELLRIGDTTNALIKFSEAIRINPNNIDAYIKRVQIRKKIGEYQRALSDINAAILINPSNLEFYSERATILTNLNDDEGAVADWTRIIGTKSSDTSRKALYFEAYLKRGIIKERYKKFTDALLDYDEASKIFPENSEVFFRRGKAKLSIGQKEGIVDVIISRKKGNKNADEFMIDYVNNSERNDSLNSYLSPEIVVTADREEYVKATKESIKIVSKGIDVLGFNLRSAGNLLPPLQGMSMPIADCEFAFRYRMTTEQNINCIILMLEKQARVFGDPEINRLVAQLK